jgi:hypothetical protein
MLVIIACCYSYCLLRSNNVITPYKFSPHSNPYSFFVVTYINHILDAGVKMVFNLFIKGGANGHFIHICNLNCFYGPDLKGHVE